jgi:glutamyl-tRNA synthetase
MEEIRLRFAPSPTGYLHVGGARTALFNWLFAKKHNGKFLLRIEDTDRSRYDENALNEIFTSLEWLGLKWDEEHCFQSQRLDLYNKYADKLIEEGFAYRCFCSEESQSRDETTSGYSKKCRILAKEESQLRAKTESFVVRLAIPQNRTISFVDAVRGEISFDSNTQDDFVLLKTDKFPTYHLANVIDDHFMKISHVLRGDEWITSTPKHVLLYEAFGWEPPVFAHLPVILGEDGTKLSKRKGAASVMDYKEDGILPDALINFLALLGWNPGDDREIMTTEELINAFDLEKVSPKASVFDRKKLEWMNGEYLKKMSNSEIYEKLKDEFSAIGAQDKEKIIAAINLTKERTSKITEIPALCDFFFNPPKNYDEQALQKVKKNPDYKTALKELKTGLATRLALTGLSGGPSLDDIIAIIGKEECIKRVDEFLKKADLS